METNKPIKRARVVVQDKNLPKAEAPPASWVERWFGPQHPSVARDFIVLVLIIFFGVLGVVHIEHIDKFLPIITGLIGYFSGTKISK
ncbi:MAG: hypothetical protein V4642_15745 [Bacteroidota bacterium]